LALLPSSASAGPVILGGDDLTDHGRVDSSGQPQEGWLYLQKALANVSSQVTRPNDGTVAALGSSSAPPENSGDAGAAIGVAAAGAGLGVTYHDGDAEIKAFFARLGAGQQRPRIIWLAGSEASNDLGSCSGSEQQAISANAAALDDFVSNGGGLISHGTCYDWIKTLLPGIDAKETGSSDDLFLTPDGLAAFPGLTDQDINAGPWHNHFEGNFGGMRVLVRSRNVKDAAGQEAAVVIGGSAVTIRPPAPPTCVNPTVVRDRKVSVPGGGSAVLVTRQFSDAATPFRAHVSMRGRARFLARAVSYTVNGQVIAVNVPATQKVKVPAAVLKRGSGRNKMTATVQLLNGRTVVINQFFIIVRCSIPRVTCQRLNATTLRCNSRTPLGVRRVTVSATSPAGGRATGRATVRRGRYTTTLKAKVSMPPGRYTYRHVGTTRKRGERMVMIRYVAVT
jgi:hypothetical protein